MLSYSSALLSTYELVVLFYLDSKEVKRIYTANDIPVYDREASIEESLRKFCEAQVEPVDQARYMKFMNFKTMTERVEASTKQFIQSVFADALEKRLKHLVHSACHSDPDLSGKGSYVNNPEHSGKCKPVAGIVY